MNVQKPTMYVKTFACDVLFCCFWMYMYFDPLSWKLYLYLEKENKVKWIKKKPDMKKWKKKKSLF